MLIISCSAGYWDISRFYVKCELATCEKMVDLRVLYVDGLIVAGSPKYYECLEYVHLCTNLDFFIEMDFENQHLDLAWNLEQGMHGYCWAGTWKLTAEGSLCGLLVAVVNPQLLGQHMDPCP